MTAPAETTNCLASMRTGRPRTSASAATMRCPSGAVTSRVIFASISSRMSLASNAGRSARFSASLFTSDSDGQPSEAVEARRCSSLSRFIPLGVWNGCSPWARRDFANRSMVGSWGSAGCG